MKVPSIKLTISLVLVALTSAVAHAGPVSSLSSAADEAARQVAEAFTPVDARVLSVLPDKQLLLDITAEQGAYVGMEMELFREGKPFKHPTTGEVLGRIDHAVGTVRLVQIQEKFSLAEVALLKQGKTVKEGDGVRVTAARLLIGLAKVTTSEGEGGLAYSASRNMEVALGRTERFEVMDERRMRSALVKAGLKDDVPLRNPEALTILRKELRLSALALPHLSEASGHFVWDVPIVSTVSGRLVRSVSVEVTSDAKPKAAARAPAPEASRSKDPRTVAARESDPSPAWLGPPDQRSRDEFLAVPYAGIPSARLVLGPEFDTAVRGIAVADFDGDGRKEVAVAVENRITIFAVDGKVFRQLWSSKGHRLERRSNILALDAADINGNGVAELFVTSFLGRTGADVNSYVLEFQDGEWVVSWNDANLFFRVLPDRQGRPTLYAQRPGMPASFADNVFSGGVEVYRWRNGRYQPTSKVKLPPGTYIYNFAVGDVKNDGGRQVVQISDSYRLRLYSGGKMRSQPPDRFGGGGVSFVVEPALVASNMISADEHDLPRYDVHPRLLVTDVNGDGKRELVAVRNLASSGYIFKNVTIYDNSKIVALRWGGLGFQVLWETQQLEGYVADIFLGDLGDGEAPVLMFALVQLKTLGLAGGRSGLFFFRFVPAEAQARQSG